MKTLLLTFCFSLLLLTGYTQTTYYWVGGTGPASITAATSWNTALDGSGSSRSVADTTDILVFNGSNIGGVVPATGAVTTTVTSFSIGQVKLVSNASVVFTRTGGGTGTITIRGSGTGDDLVIEAGSSLSINSTLTNGNVQMILAVGTTGRVSGAFSMSNNGQHRITNTTAGSPGSLVFTSGSAFTSNITSATNSYPFGSNGQSTEKWVVFESGANLYYEGGWSPMGNNSAFSAINFLPGSNWYHRATNVIPTVFGSFFNTKSFGNIIVENNAILGSDGPIYRIGNLTINNGSGFTTHSSGQTAMFGNLTVDGSLSAPAGSTNVLVMGGSGVQTISGSGSIVIPSLTVSDNSEVALNRNVTVGTSTNIYGKINFNTYNINGAGSFTSRVNNTATGVTGNLTAGSYQVTGTVGALANLNGLTITGTGIAPNTSIVGFSSGGATINLSNPIVSGGSNVPLTFKSDTALLATSNANGFDSTAGSVVVTGTKTYQSGTSYTINAATAKPFGLSTGSGTAAVNAGVVEFNASATTNASVNIHGALQLNAGKVTIRTTDTIRIMPGATVNGNFNSSNYFITEANTSTGAQGTFRYDGISSSKLFPIGSSNYYLPATVNPAAVADFTASVFEGITVDGTPNGIQLSAAQKQTKVNAAWNIKLVNGSGAADLQLQWDQALEGSTFSTLNNTEIGIITNQNPGWSLPTGTGNNSTNTANSNFSAFGAFAVGAKPPAQSFTFNPIPDKTYGNADFNGGAISLNTTQPIIYTSSNPAVATIVNGNIHITGTGTTNITASQAGDGFYPPANVTQTLTVNKATLTIKADDKSKPEGDPNPAFTVTYSGFVYGETAAVLTTPVTVTTTAVTTSPPGTYPIVPAGATAANYNIVFTNGVLTVAPRQTQTITFNALAAKTYGNADFAAGATSTNNTIPITYTSSNPAVATVSGSTIHITGAGTTTITASQAGNSLFFPAANVSRTLTVNKANLTVRAADTTRNPGEANPVFRLIYTGFVSGENASVLATQPTATTTATALSAPGYYIITPANGVSANYNFIYVNGRLTILPLTGTSQSNIQVYRSSANVLTVKIYSPEPDLADVVLYNINGSPLVKRNVFLPQGFINFDLPVKSQLSGTYIVYVYGRNGELKKVINIIR
ncbi:MAG: MBG domain-containing protein [Chitinophagaceae bacterium]